MEMESESCLGTDRMEAVEGHLQGRGKKKRKVICREGRPRHENAWREIEEREEYKERHLGKEM